MDENLWIFYDYLVNFSAILKYFRDPGLRRSRLFSCLPFWALFWIGQPFLQIHRKFQKYKGNSIIFFIAKMSNNLFIFDLSFPRTSFVKSRRVERYLYGQNCMCMQFFWNKAQNGLTFSANEQNSMSKIINHLNIWCSDD